MKDHTFPDNYIDSTTALAMRCKNVAGVPMVDPYIGNEQAFQVMEQHGIRDSPAKRKAHGQGPNPFV